MTDEQANDLAELQSLRDDVAALTSAVLTAREEAWSTFELLERALVPCGRLKDYFDREIQAAEDRLPRCEAEADYYGEPLVCGLPAGHTHFHRDESMNCEWTDAP